MGGKAKKRYLIGRYCDRPANRKCGRKEPHDVENGAGAREGCGEGSMSKGGS